MLRKISIFVVLAVFCSSGFVYAQPPTGISLTNPASGATNTPLSVVFTWTGGNRAATYDFYLSTSSNPAKLITLPGNVKAHTVTLSPVTKYYWKVVARNLRGTKSTNVWSFTTGAGIVLPPASEEICGDGRDNDNDGQVDEGCATPPPPPPPPPLPNPSPDGTLSPSLVDCERTTWTIGPSLETLRNNAHAGQGYGSIYKLVSCVVYVKGTDATWYRWENGWTSTGQTQEPGTTTPPPPPPAPATLTVMFNPSPEHTLIQHYRITLEDVATGQVVYDNQIGKPSPNANNDIVVTIPESAAFPLNRVYIAKAYSFGTCKDENGAVTGTCYGMPSVSAPFTKNSAARLTAVAPRPTTTPMLSVPLLPRPLPSKQIEVEFVNTTSQRVTRATFRFTCTSEQIPSELIVSPLVNPSQLVWSYRGEHCRANIEKTIAMLSNGTYRAQIKQGDDIFFALQSFTVKR